MIKHFLFAVALTIISVGAFSQELAKAPKFFSVEAGYRHIASTSFDIKTQGATLLIDYAWQLSGFNGKPAAFISVPLGYTSLFGGSSANSCGILSYGWTVRHNLKANRNIIPFFGYGLLLNQLRIKGIEGSSFGHQTRFDYGYLFNTQKKTNPFVKIEYSYTRYPHMGVAKSDKIHAFEVKAGVRF